MEFKRQTATMDILDPAAGYQPARLTLEQRWDPLTGQGCRLLPPLNLFPPAEVDIGEIAPGPRRTAPAFPTRRPFRREGLAEAHQPGCRRHRVGYLEGRR
jgi:hypothetical protein